ncbi:hypothetical protein F383_29973 [Gossypium arboreum]|uniref:Uncharacterized protein n=1 Tax=Gossypium arboreum TaxID=29729 RepID=A0A0B0MY94_GOSAR|nr:hypothetical protein F383_29973 [Gossypium arboreum]
MSRIFDFTYLDLGLSRVVEDRYIMGKMEKTRMKRTASPLPMTKLMK